MSIKDLIRAGREHLGITEQRFADLTGVTRSAVQQWEKGETAPRRSNQQAVANLLGITVGELMSGASEKYPLATAENKTVSDIGPKYDLSLMLEARTLLEAMDETGQKEAIEYMRYLATRHPASRSKDAADRTGDTVSTRRAAA